MLNVTLNKKVLNHSENLNNFFNLKRKTPGGATKCVIKAVKKIGKRKQLTNIVENFGLTNS